MDYMHEDEVREHLKNLLEIGNRMANSLQPAAAECARIEWREYVSKLEYWIVRPTADGNVIAGYDTGVLVTVRVYYGEGGRAPAPTDTLCKVAAVLNREFPKGLPGLK